MNSLGHGVFACIIVMLHVFNVTEQSRKTEDTHSLTSLELQNRISKVHVRIRYFELRVLGDLL